MRKSIRISFLLASLIMLGATRFSENTIKSDEAKLAVESAISTWKKDMQNVNIDYVPGLSKITAIRIIDSDGKHAGIQSNATGIIYIAEGRINKGPYSILATVYHELGHAVFHLPHGSCELMNVHVYSEEKYNEYWNEYKQEYMEVCVASASQAKR